jgi:chain length determinant protein tyrosine kinase EpsG
MNAFSQNDIKTDAQVDTPDGSRDRSIGDLIRDLRSLSAEEVERILQYQSKQGVRFGEAAVALGLASEEDVLSALATQFSYPLATSERRAGSPELVVLNEPFSVQAEAIRTVRSQVTMRLHGAEFARTALAVISPEDGDGKSFFAANLAVSLAQLGGQTLLVDADLRSPRQHEIFKISNGAGLSAVLSGRTEARVIQAVTGVPGLYVLPAGAIPPNPLELIERPAFGLLLGELSQKFDHVVVDTGSALHGADGYMAATKCGAALVVTRQGQSRTANVRELVDALSGSAVKLLGVVMNDY